MANEQRDLILLDLILLEKLPQTDGWATMSQAARHKLQVLTSNALHSYGDAEASAKRAFGDSLVFCVRVGEVDRFLKQDKNMSLWEWAEKVFEGNFQKILRAKKHYDRLIENVKSDDNILALAHSGVPGMTDVAPGRFVTAVKALPAPKNANERVKWVKQVQEKVRTGFVTNRKSDPAKMSREEAVRSVVIEFRRVCRQARVKDLESLRSVLQEAGGYCMGLVKIPGTITCKPTPIPDGYLPKVGFPLGKKRKKPSNGSVMSSRL